MRALTSQAIMICGLCLTGPGSSVAAGQAGEPGWCKEASAKAGARGAAVGDIQRLAACGISGPEAVAGLWRQAPIATDVDLLAGVSGALRDERVYLAVSQVAASTSRPAAERLQALRVLYALLGNGDLPRYEALLRPRIGGMPYDVETESSPHRRRGVPVERPLDEARVAQLPSLLYQLATSDGDPLVRGAAARLRQAIARTDPDNTPLPPGVIHIAAECRGVVALWSTADIFLPVRIQVPGTGFERAQGLPGEWADPHARARFRAPDGVVVVTFGSRELVRLTDRTVAGCPV